MTTDLMWATFALGLVTGFAAYLGLAAARANYRASTTPRPMTIPEGLAKFYTALDNDPEWSCTDEVWAALQPLGLVDLGGLADYYFDLDNRWAITRDQWVAIAMEAAADEATGGRHKATA